MFYQKDSNFNYKLKSKKPTYGILQISR